MWQFFWKIIQYANRPSNFEETSSDSHSTRSAALQNFSALFGRSVIMSILAYPNERSMPPSTRASSSHHEKLFTLFIKFLQHKYLRCCCKRTLEDAKRSGKECIIFSPFLLYSRELVGTHFPRCLRTTHWKMAVNVIFL